MKEKIYLRDGRSPIPDNTVTSKVMSKNRSKDTRPELILRKALFSNKIRGYRLHLKNIPGRPDISFTNKKIAVFVNGCFWHRCPHCNLSLPKSNTEFWEEKFSKNKKRDYRKSNELLKLGWSVLVIWECQIKNDVNMCVGNIKNIINESS